jgi:hypothetical protein
MSATATISNQLFALSLDSSSVPAWATLLPGLLASLLQATVIRPLLLVVLQWARVAKLQGISSFTGLSAATWFVVACKVTTEAVQLLLSEQPALWVLYVVAPRTFDVSRSRSGCSGRCCTCCSTASRASLYSKACFPT